MIINLISSKYVFVSVINPVVYWWVLYWFWLSWTFVNVSEFSAGLKMCRMIDMLKYLVRQWPNEVHSGRGLKIVIVLTLLHFNFFRITHTVKIFHKYLHESVHMCIHMCVKERKNICQLISSLSLRSYNSVQNTIFFLNSRYMFFFQIPWLPEIFVGGQDLALLSDVFTSLRQKGSHVFGEDDLEAYKYNLKNFGQLMYSWCILYNKNVYPIIMSSCEKIILMEKCVQESCLFLAGIFPPKVFSTK